MFETEGRKLEAALVGLWVTLHAVVIDTEAIKAVALVVTNTPHTLGFAVFVLDAERRITSTPCVVFGITGDTGVIDTLAVITFALRVVITGDTFIAIVTGNADPKGTLAASVTTDLAGLAGA